MGIGTGDIVIINTLLTLMIFCLVRISEKQIGGGLWLLKPPKKVKTIDSKYWIKISESLCDDKKDNQFDIIICK